MTQYGLIMLQPHRCLPRVVGTLAVDGSAVTVGTAMRGPGGLRVTESEARGRGQSFGHV